VLRLVDAFTVAICHPLATPDAESLQATLKGPLITEPFSCAVQIDKERCEAGGGVCTMTRDGYYNVNIICVVVGLITFIWYIRPKVLALQKLPLRAWRLSDPAKGKE
jgi:PAT family acetyl-CoA transporter-like MFS transporter 1